VKHDPVEVAFLHAAARTIRREDSVLVACSGGGDSVALLHLFRRMSDRRRPRLIVAHLDHGSRRGSKADLAFVRALARDLDIPFVSERREVVTLRRKGESPEEAARRVRHAFLREAAREHGASRIALGHTLDDQAETILMRLVRGAGPTALLGMREAGPGPLVRPLLDVEREAVRAWLRRRRIAFREDPSNRSLRFDRNKVRLLVMPVLRARLNPKAARHIADGMARLREDADTLDALAREAAEAIGADADAVDRLPRAIAGRVRRLLC
jgi:tRNA(Ile)-lysidine synthase